MFCCFDNAWVEKLFESVRFMLFDVWFFSHSLSPFPSLHFVLFFVNISKVILRVNWGPIKIVFHVMLDLKSAWQWIRLVSFFVFFLLSLSPEWGNLNWTRILSASCRCGVTNNHWLTVPSFHVTVSVIVSDKTTALCRPTLHWDFGSHSLSYVFPSFTFHETWRFLVRKFIVWFSGWDYHFTFYDWWRAFGSFSCLTHSLSLVGSSMCLRMQIIINVDVRETKDR